MRVVSGRFRGRRLIALEGTATRPMLGRMRRTMFDILQGQIEGRVFADLYAGTGSVGIEALSRGAKAAVFVESSPRAAAVIRSNLETVGAADQAQLRRALVSDVIGKFDADIYFLGPPYEATKEYASTLSALATQAAQWVIAQHSKHLELAERYGTLSRARVVKIGSNRLSMFRHEAQETRTG